MQSPEINVQGEFATPFYSLRHPMAEPLNKALMSYILGQEAQGEKFRNPEYIPSNQVEIFESSFELFKENEPCIQQLKQFFMHGILQAVSRTNGYSMEECGKLKVFFDAWYHVTRFGGYISNHIHPNATWSAVYMVDPGEQAEQYPKGGVLSFKDPRTTANMYMDPGNMKWQRPHHLGSINYEMQPGDLMVFPSFVQHEVTPYFGQIPRVTIAANCSFQQN